MCVGEPRSTQDSSAARPERWFEELTSVDAGDDADFDDVSRRHGIVFYRDSPWTQELRDRFGL